jgi:N-methylhydantoinase A
MAARGLRFAADTGGTFTDLIVEDDAAGSRFFKRPTTPDDPVRGLLDVIGAAAAELGCTASELLGRGKLFIFGTTRATNAIVEGAAARTALLVTRGHPDVLLWREGGGRTTLFDYTQEYPDPYVPRALTYEVPERIGAGGEVVEELDEAAVVELAGRLRSEAVEAVAVCLLWSVVNPAHEERVGALLDVHLPGVPYTLSHRLNPTVREYRRASSAAIDASLKPLMSRFFGALDAGLREAGSAAGC